MKKVIEIVSESSLKNNHRVAGVSGVGEADFSTPHLMALPPLTLYVHVPWCVRKCPYCDFNSHQAPDSLPEELYLKALEADLEQSLPEIWGRQVHAIFIGGGTPSLLSEGAIDKMLAMFRSRLPVWPDAEITLEANPGTVEANRFSSYSASGINRLSIGIQSFNDHALKKLGRIHDSAQARKAIDIAQRAVPRINLDLMFALPGQTLDECIADANQALTFGTEHLSMYQLTIESQTVFAKYPPELPEDDLSAEMEQTIEQMARQAGFERYEVSAFAKKGARSRHNLNYWEFGDYLGVGPGAHSKISFPDRIIRYARTRNPESWMQGSIARDGSHLSETRSLTAQDLPFEFMLNALRLREGVPLSLYTDRCGLNVATLSRPLQTAIQKGLLFPDPTRFKATQQGWLFLNELQSLFL